jgi:uncharacterized membrane protein
LVLTMRRHIFWVITATVLALSCHVAYLLFVPSRSFSRAIDQALGEDHGNKFVLLDPIAQLKLIPSASSDHVVGICKFNVSEGPVRVTANVPEGFWSFAVYTIRGRQVYAINDTQADTDTFSVELSQDKGLLSQILGAGEDTNEVIGDDIGWRIAITETQGLAVLWLAVADPLLRKEAEDVVKQSRCVRLESAS